jgi:pentatricopeptide repeat protein
MSAFECEVRLQLGCGCADLFVNGIRYPTNSPMLTSSFRRVLTNIWQSIPQSSLTHEYHRSLLGRCCQRRYLSNVDSLPQEKSVILPDKAQSLRATPYSFTSDPTFRGAGQKGRLARYNIYIGQFAQRGKAVDAFRYAKEMKEEGVMPDLTTYNALLQACALSGLYTEAWALMEDMQALGIKPDRTSFHHVMKVK